MGPIDTPVIGGAAENRWLIAIIPPPSIFGKWWGFKNIYNPSHSPEGDVNLGVVRSPFAQSSLSRAGVGGEGVQNPHSPGHFII